PLSRPFDKGQLNLSREETSEHLICISAASRDSDLRVCSAKSSDERWQEVLTDGLRGSQGEFACMLAKCLRHRGKGFVGELLHFLGKGQQGLSPGGQRDMST